ncbi:hypothetical protein LTS14_001228 [Recurvomyces mirabilis]|uniref:uncharacterized protein n=1 Tax=Recurvomyces mirabilis TaxID=574656 RepID=UPI002DE1B1B4|nr:hypothetical protein LTS14_001228 [Recurvomyces mirabilis]
MRIAEIIGDYRNIQTYIAAIRASPSAEEYNEEGYLVLRRCVAAAQALLAQPFQTTSSSRGDDEQDKIHLRSFTCKQRQRYDGSIPEAPFSKVNGHMQGMLQLYNRSTHNFEQ